MKGCFAVFTQVAAIYYMFCTWSFSIADEARFRPPEDESAKFQTEVLIEGLNNPCGLASRPAATEDTVDEFFFAESGAGRVLRFAVDSPTKTQEVLGGLNTLPFGNEKPLEVGPWALGFLTPSKLVVLGGVLENGKEQVGVYALSEESRALSADQTDHTVGPLAIGNNQPRFLGIAMGETAAYFSSGAESAPGQIFYSALEANRLDSFRPLLKEQIDEWPAGLCLSPVNSAGSQYLVASYVGGLQEARDSKLVFLAPVSGTLLLQIAPGLFDLVGLAYSDSGQLYAVDFAWQQPEGGGVYRLDDARLEGRPACRAVKIASMIHPTSLAFDSKGAMLVTTWGSLEKPKQGQIIKIIGEF